MVLEPAARPAASQRLHELPEPRAPLLEVLELVVARAGGREEDDLAALGVGVRLGDRPLEVDRVPEAHALARQRLRDLVGRLADQVRAGDARLAGAGASPPNGVPLRLPPRITRSPGG